MLDPLVHNPPIFGTTIGSYYQLLKAGVDGLSGSTTSHHAIAGYWGS